MDIIRISTPDDLNQLMDFNWDDDDLIVCIHEGSIQRLSTDAISELIDGIKAFERKAITNGYTIKQDQDHLHNDYVYHFTKED
jgi:hypothetical protein